MTSWPPVPRSVSVLDVPTIVATLRPQRTGPIDGQPRRLAAYMRLIVFPK